MQFSDEDDTPMTIDDGTEVPFFPEGSSAGSGETKLLFGLGFLATGMGVAIALAPHFSWTLASLGRQLAGMGISAGTPMVAGVVLIGLGFVARVAGRRSRASLDDLNNLAPEAPSIDFSETTGRLDALANGMHALEAGMNDLAIRISHPQPSQLGTREELVEAFGRKQNDALFRLAASLDQLGARLEKHFDRGTDTLAGTVTHLVGTLQTFQDHMQSELTQVLHSTRTYAVPPEYAQYGAPGQAPQPAQAQAQVQVQVQVQPHESAPESAPEPALIEAAPAALPAGVPAAGMQAAEAPVAQQAYVEAPFPQGQPVAVPQAEGQVAQYAAQPVAAEVAYQQPVPPAQPAGPQAQQPSEAGIEGSPEDLEQLLPDYRVREALDGERLPPI